MMPGQFVAFFDISGTSAGIVYYVIRVVNFGTAIEAAAGVSQVVAAISGPIPALALVTNTMAFTLGVVASNDNGATLRRLIGVAGNLLGIGGGGDSDDSLEGGDGDDTLNDTCQIL